MTPELQNYINFNPSTDDGGYEESKRLKKLVNPDELKAYYKAEKEKFFIEENENVDSRKTTLSPSEKYSLTTSSFKTKTGSWNYSQGKVYLAGSNQPIAIVNRNYGHFPFLFQKHMKNFVDDYIRDMTNENGDE
jgi:hypothetical protein